MRQDITEQWTLPEHLFRIEYGKIVSVVAKYLGLSNLHYAEDIAQETFLKAATSWQHNGIPPNPEAWLYVVAKNLCLNFIKREKLKQHFISPFSDQPTTVIEDLDLNFSTESIVDDQLRMMFACCQDSINTKSQLALMLKILCGFSVQEIATAFFSSYETINKRLTRAKNKLRQNEFLLNNISFTKPQIETVLKAIYLLFNEGYSPSDKEETIRKDLCFQAIRLCELIYQNKNLNQGESYALLSLMYFNASRFEARLVQRGDLIEMQDQDRTLWNQALITKGLYYLNHTLNAPAISAYHILAAISAHHCIAETFDDTNWKEILYLYDDLIKVDRSPLNRLNRSVAISYVKGNAQAIQELKTLEVETDISDHHLFHSTISAFYAKEKNIAAAEKHLHLAAEKALNERDQKIIQKKLSKLVPFK